MPSFDWREYQERSLAARFPDWAIGYDLWRRLSELGPEGIATILDGLIRLHSGANWGRPPLACPRVFVSHRRVDVAEALAIARIANREGFQFWLDVLDPSLSWLLGPPQARGPDTARVHVAWHRDPRPVRPREMVPR